ncbi:regulatory protein RecX [Alloalcanivorax profundimaris]|uniref:regulatory protein RecX n=1 Tax=Alloalcanivorax profundimaris TaxID=2735259 RepID=UPI001888B36E|nr:regulatory protein RecX [Alloalcanivorax profundimaris]MBF1802660.1 regulatory protein RecX [Alloalcanivorax profundimaris]MCQ6262158.1 recombination regulator RecX [Alcanivorax sp. MM125-6]
MSERRDGAGDGPVDEATLRQYAIKLLARRDHARSELALKMRRKFGDEAPLEAVLGWCEEHDFLDDRRFAGFFVRSRIERGQGPLRIRAELREKGVAEPLVAEALDETDCDWFALAREVHGRRFRQAPADRKEKAKQLRFLQSRGFDAEQSFAALDAFED